jgi:xanthine dehydrogenase accessory factor
MRETRKILEKFSKICADEKIAALASVAAVEGSSYRKPGAIMLIAPDGETLGSISGGCLERDVTRLGRQLIDHGGSPVVKRYQTSDSEDNEPGTSLGCGGTIDILIERVSKSSPGPLSALDAAVNRRLDAALATIVRGESIGQRLVRVGDQDPIGNVADPLLHSAMIDMLDAIEPGGADVRRADAVDGTYVDILVQSLRPPQALVIFGDGHDAIPVVEFAKGLGWHVTVVGPHARRFTSADAVVYASKENPTGGLNPGEDDAVVVMGHDGARDTAVLAALLKRPPAYIGLLGPRHRSRRLLQMAGGSEADKKIYWPVGLDIGATTPEEIAMAVLAEICAVLAGRRGGSLRNRPGPIHRNAAPSMPPDQEVRDSCQL